MCVPIGHTRDLEGFPLRNSLCKAYQPSAVADKFPGQRESVEILCGVTEAEVLLELCV